VGLIEYISVYLLGENVIVIRKHFPGLCYQSLRRKKRYSDLLTKSADFIPHEGFLEWELFS
jgi:hypothetical protein